MYSICKSSKNIRKISEKEHVTIVEIQIKVIFKLKDLRKWKPLHMRMGEILLVYKGHHKLHVKKHCAQIINYNQQEIRSD